MASNCCDCYGILDRKEDFHHPPPPDVTAHDVGGVSLESWRLEVRELDTPSDGASGRCGSTSAGWLTTVDIAVAPLLANPEHADNWLPLSILPVEYVRYGFGQMFDNPS